MLEASSIFLLINFFRLAYFHNRVFEELYKLTKTPTKLPFDWSGLRNRIFDYIAVGRSEFVNTFHIFIAYLIDNIIQTGYVWLLISEIKLIYKAFFVYCLIDTEIKKNKWIMLNNI